MKLINKLVILAASTAMIGGAITFAASFNNDAKAASAEEATVELDFTKISSRADSDNGYTAGGVKCSTWNLYTANAGTASGTMKLPATVKNLKTNTMFNDADVYIQMYSANQRFVLSFPGESTWGAANDFVLIHIKKGTSFGGNTVLAEDMLIYGRLHSHTSGAISLDLWACDYANSYALVSNELVKRNSYDRIDTEVTKFVSITSNDAEGYFKFNTSINDANLLTTYWNFNGGNTKTINTNALSHIKVKYSYSDEYLPIAYYLRPDGSTYINEGSTYRLALATPYEANSKFRYIKFEQGLELLSYEYCSAATAADPFKVYVNTQTVEFAQNEDVKNNTNYAKTDPSNPTQCDYTEAKYAIPGDWNDASLHQTTRNGKQCTEFIVSNSTNGKFKESGTANLNEALGAGALVTLNGVPFGDLNTAYMGYNHGDKYIFFYVPNEYLNTTYNGGLATIEVKPGTRFEGHYLNGFTLVYNPQTKISQIVGAYNQTHKAASVSYAADEEGEIGDNGAGRFVRIRASLNYDDADVIEALGAKATYHRYFLKNLDTGEVTYQVQDNGIKNKTNRFIIDNVFTKGQKSNVGRYAVIIPAGTPLINGSYNAYYKNSVIFYLTVGVNTYKTSETMMGERAQYALTVKEFVNDYLHMNWGNASTNEGKCLGADGYYALAKRYLVETLGAEFIAEFQNNEEFAAAKARYESWATLNGDTTPYVKNAQFSSNRAVVNNSTNDTIIIAVTALSMLGILGFYVFKRKRA